MSAVQKALEHKTVAYTKPNGEQSHIIDLQIGCYAQSQLAKHSVDCVVETVTREQWLNGVYLLFESAVSRVFFETYVHLSSPPVHCISPMSCILITVAAVTQVCDDIARSSGRC